MDDATLVTRSKNRLTRLKTLKDWTMETVLSNLDAYTQEEGANCLRNKLSPELRDYFLQELIRSGTSEEFNNMKEFDRMKRSVFVLMSTRTKKLDLNVLMSFFPSGLSSELDFIEVLRMVSIAAPNVQHLKIGSRHIRICLYNNEFRNACLEYLSSLKELRILELVGIFFNPMDLVELCRELRNLQVLSTPGSLLEGTNMTEEDIRLSFGHLRLLNINISQSEKLMNKNWKVLSNLDILPHDILPTGLTLEDFLEDENIPRERKYLNFERHLRESNVRADFSSIRYLEFHCLERRWNDFEENLKLPASLDRLSLFMLISQETVDAILHKFGANLRWLSLSGGGYQSVDLNRISELCPMLEVLSMTSVDVTRNTTQEIKFCHLKELDITKGMMMNESLTALLSSCPNLRQLKLSEVHCVMDDEQKVKNLIMEKKILGSLQALQWDITSSTPDLVFDEIVAIVKNASAILADLRKMKINFDGSKLHINSRRMVLFYQSDCIGSQKLIKDADKNLFEILNLYE